MAGSERLQPVCRGVVRRSGAAGEAVLAPGLEGDHRDRVRQVQAALAGPHRQAQPLLGRKAVAQPGRQAGGLGAEHQPVAGLEGDLVRRPRAPGREREQAAGVGLHGLQEAVPVGMAAQFGVFVVIQPGAPQQLVVHREAQRLDQVQLAAGVGTEPDHVAGVRRDFGVDEDDVEHGFSLGWEPGCARTRVR